jgi:outer membrane lipoprotein carrier protein
MMTPWLAMYLMALAATDAGVPAKSTSKPEAGVVVAVDAGTSQVDAGVAAPVKKAALAPDVKALVDRVQGFYEATKDFTADFKQEYLYKAFKRTVTSSGKVLFRKPQGAMPSLMRWEYEKPSPKTFVLAGDRVLAHDPEAKLVTAAAISTNQLSASVTFLFGVGKLENEFDIVKTTCAKCTGTQLEMTPLVADPRFKKILLEVDVKTGMVLKSTVIDPDGSENAISFLNLKTNVGVAESAFKISPPPGTQVQDFRTGEKITVPGKQDGGVSLDAGK